MKVSRGPSAVLFAVSYQGPRLSPKEIEESLELYYPARLRKDQVLGATDMGLGLVRKVARLIGGDLVFSATEEGFATVTLSCAFAAVPS